MELIIDTSIFVNPDSRRFFGKTTDQALENFLDKLGKTEIICHMPPSVYEELMYFVEKPMPSNKSILINKTPPSSYQTPIPALFLYEFIEEMRGRINKGLRITEKYARKAIENVDQDVIKSLRGEYRAALREGVLDSKEDFDLILLAKERGASIATSDNGLVKWAHKLGITCLTAEELKETLDKQL